MGFPIFIGGVRAIIEQTTKTGWCEPEADGFECVQRMQRSNSVSSTSNSSEKNLSDLWKNFQERIEYYSAASDILSSNGFFVITSQNKKTYATKALAEADLDIAKEWFSRLTSDTGSMRTYPTDNKAWVYIVIFEADEREAFVDAVTSDLSSHLFVVGDSL